MAELTRREREILDAIRDGRTEPYSEPVYLPTWAEDYTPEQETEQAPEVEYTGHGWNCLVMCIALGSLVAGAAGAVVELIRWIA